MKYPTTINAQLSKLKQIILAKHPAARFTPGIDWKDLSDFEAANGIKIPKELAAFYAWHNGVDINSELSIPSLEEAYLLFKTNDAEGIRRPNLKDLAPPTLEEVEKLLSPQDDSEENIIKHDRVWLPMYIINRPLGQKAVFMCYVLPQTDSLNHAVLESSSYDDMAYSTVGKNDRIILRSLPEILNTLMELVDPPKKTFFQKMKDLINVVGSFFEGL